MKVLVLGAAVSGRAALDLARRLGHLTAVYDRRSEAVAALVGHETHSGTWHPGLLRGVELVVTSPGFPETSEPIRDTLAAGIPLLSELEFAARHLDAPYLAVTGTNGKTTVVETAAAMLAAAGRRTVAAGNVGLALSSVVGEPWDVVVVEASSFQLRFVDGFRPLAAGITNVAPDHLDLHPDLAAYRAAKARIFERMGPDDPVAYDVDDPGAATLVADAPVRLVPVSGRRPLDDGVGVVEGRLDFGGRRVEASTTDPSFLVDLALAGALALEAGAGLDAVAEVAAAFEPGAHRRRLVAEIDGVRWVDDSKATNPHAAVAAARSFSSVILLAGGRNKGLDLTPLASIDSVRRIVAFGEAAAELAALDAPVDPVADLEEAVARAAELARPGDTVLLAPGCASFDAFPSYAARGARFAELVEGRMR